MFYRLLLVLMAVTVIAHCGKPHHGKPVKSSTGITIPQEKQAEQDAA